MSLVYLFYILEETKINNSMIAAKNSIKGVNKTITKLKKMLK